jgi:hypothetical protein
MSHSVKIYNTCIGCVWDGKRVNYLFKESLLIVE